MADELTRAERKMAALFLTELDVDVEPAKLSAFIKAKWRTIAPLAHIIHEGPDFTKRPANQLENRPPPRSSCNGY